MLRNDEWERTILSRREGDPGWEGIYRFAV